MMIPLNLKEQDWKSYEGYGKYGYVSSTRFPEYEGYNVTIIDDVTKSEYERVTGLIHLSSNVRVIQDFKYGKDLQYLMFPPGNNGEEFSFYPKTSLSASEALMTLREIFYKLEPELQVREIVGFDTSKGLEYNPNKAEGAYLLNDEDIYFIIREKGKVTFGKGGVIVKEYPFVTKKNYTVLAEEDIDYDLYKCSLEYSRFKKQISLYANKYLKNGELEQKVKQFNSLEDNINTKLKN